MVNRQGIFTIFLLSCVFGLRGQEVRFDTPIKQADKLHITVFIHGSVHCHLSMLSLSGVWKDDLKDDSWYIKMLEKVRQNPLLWQSRFMLGLGPQEIDSDVIKRFHKRALHKEEAKIAAYHIVPAYDALMRQVEKEHRNHKYYAYGHLGLLSQSYRKQVGGELYNWLCDLIDQEQKAYNEISIDIVAHSHGGNIALWLGAFEEQFKRGLYIENLIMDGTPIQVETFQFAYRPVFGRVFNRHSDGDRVQGVDRLSTIKGKSYKKFSDSRLPIHYRRNHVYDVRLIVNNNRKYIGHGNMVLMDYPPLVQALRPAPFITFTPLFLEACRDLHNHEFDCNLIDQPGMVMVELKDQQGVFAYSQNVAAHTFELQQLISYNWCPDTHGRFRSQASQMGRITIDAIRELWQDGAIKKEEMPKLIARL